MSPVPLPSVGRLTETPTPHIDAVFALTKLLAKTMEEERAAAAAGTRSAAH